MTGSPDRPVRYPGLAGLSWLSESELRFLIDQLPGSGLFIEVGTASGVTAARIADERPGLDLVCVDTFPDHDEPHVTADEPSRVDLWRGNRRPNMSLWLGTLADLARLAPGSRADAILVDADHAKPGVSADLDLADGLLRPGGLLFAHDCDEPGWPDVTVAVDRFCERRGFETIGQHWTMRALKRCQRSED